ncbi:peptidase inhibitor 16-like [Coccinella septempunctata]|uniref:peptidase inhibitor 16-like n=1 Tax=Coccinella septempunctata TaxID=41139 RepID=UPI001D0884DF|nr:peptidase inhibitor 16-like [Coccinella septempunctata]
MKIYFVFYLLLRTTDSSDVDYCLFPCHVNNETVEHVMCTLKHDCSVGPECKVKTKFEYTGGLKSFTLDLHNYYRNKIASGEALGQNDGNLPQAADMMELVWDEELAYFAQCYANKCILQYDKCRQSSAGENIGQLIFFRVSVKPKSVQEIITEMLESAYYSSSTMPLEDVENYKDNKHTKQFAQLAWSGTSRLGCGVTKLLENVTAFFMVCNYGNVEGEMVYEVGAPCSRCPDGRRCGKRYFALCAAREYDRRTSREKAEVLRSLETMLNTDEELQQHSENNTILTEASLTPGQVNVTSSQNITWSTTKMEVAISDIPSFETSYAANLEVATDKDAQMIGDISKKQKGPMVLLERMVSEAVTEDPPINEIDDEDVLVRRCMVKRKDSWPELENQDSGSRNKRTSIRFISIFTVLLHGILKLKCE